jgi:membrane fusion protein, multidrug efflux system
VQGQPALRQGMFAKGQIELARKSALALPVTAVRTDRAKPYVLQIEAGQARLREVTLGSLGEVNGQAWVEIASGLPAGADVLAGSVGALRDGTAVRLMSTASKAPANGNAAASESASR